MDRPLSCRRGFSLAEMIVVMAIVGGISGVVAMSARMGRQSWEVEQARMSVSYELRRGIDAMSRELAESRANRLTGVPADGQWYNALTLNVPQDRDGDGTVLDAAGLLEWSEAITYGLGGPTGNQIRRTDPAGLRVLANGVTALQFRRRAATPNIVEIRMTVQRGTGSPGGFLNQATLGTTVRLRN